MSWWAWLTWLTWSMTKTPGSCQQKALTMGASAALREDTTPTERVWCFNVWYLPTTFLLLKRVKVSEFFAVRCGFQICVLPPSLAPQNIWIDVFQQKWSVHMSKFEFAREKDVKHRSRSESETVPFVALEKGIWSSDEAWLSALQVGNHPTQRLCLVWRLTNCYWLS